MSSNDEFNFEVFSDVQMSKKRRRGQHQRTALSADGRTLSVWGRTNFRAGSLSYAAQSMKDPDNKTEFQKSPIFVSVLHKTSNTSDLRLVFTFERPIDPLDVVRITVRFHRNFKLLATRAVDFHLAPPKPTRTSHHSGSNSEDDEYDNDEEDEDFVADKNVDDVDETSNGARLITQMKNGHPMVVPPKKRMCLVLNSSAGEKRYDSAEKSLLEQNQEDDARIRQVEKEMENERVKYDAYVARSRALIDGIRQMQNERSDQIAKDNKVAEILRDALQKMKDVDPNKFENVDPEEDDVDIVA